MTRTRTRVPNKILMTTDTVGGVFTFVCELARALEPHGVSVVLAAIGRPLSREQRECLRQLDHVEVYESRGALEWMHDPWADVNKTGAWLLELEENHAPDCVHLNEYAFGALPFRSPSVLTGHSCVASWWQSVHKTPLPARWDKYTTVVRQGLLGATRVVAPSQAMLNSLEHHYGPLRESRVIANGIDASRVRAAQKVPWVASAARLWDEAKNTDALVRVAAGLPWPVLLAGDRKSEGTGMEADPAGVVFLGELARDRVLSLLARSAIYALPARYEPFGFSVLEAAVNRCALVLGEIPSLRENWEGAASFVDPDDPAALSFELERLIADDVLRERRAEAAYARARRFSSARMAHAYLGLYASLVTPDETNVAVPSSCAS